MPQYSYEAVNSAGKAVRGKITADSISGASAALRGRGLLITALREEAGPAEDGAAPSFDLNDLLMKLSIVRQADIVLLLRQMATIIKAGVSIVDTLSVLEKQARRRKMRFILSSVRQGVEAGKPLSEAMEQFPRTFPPVVTSVLKTGEATGLLDTAMERVADLWDEKLALLRQTITSIVYPVLVLVVTIGAVIFLISYVLPNIIPFLKSMGGRLPWNTKLLVDLGENFPAIAPKAGAGLGAAAGLLALAWRWPASRYYIDRYKIRLPLLGPVFQYSLIVNFASTLALLINSGVPVVDALKSTNETITNLAAKRVIERVTDRVLSGENLSEPLLEAGGVFPPMVGTMVRVGEETGGVDYTLSMVARVFTEMLQTHLKRLTTLIEPALIVFLGGLVAFVASSLVSGILASYGQIAR